MDNLFSRLLVVAALFGAALALNAQCEIDYDFGDEPWGVSPDPTLGETFDTGMLGASYDDVLHIKVPSNANVIDETIDTIDSVHVFQDLIDDEGTYLGVVFVDTATQEQFFADELGLQVTFNNNGSSPIPYSFCQVVNIAPPSQVSLPGRTLQREVGRCCLRERRSFNFIRSLLRTSMFA